MGVQTVRAGSFLVGVVLACAAASCSDGGAEQPPATTTPPTVTSTTAAATPVTTATPKPEDPPIDRDTIEVRAREFAEITRATVDAWDAHDLEAIRRLYTVDIVHDDARFRTYEEGIEDVMGIAEAMFSYQTPNVRFRASPEFGAGFIGDQRGIMVWEAWDVFGFTEESPLVEVDRLVIRDSLIESWELHYENPSPHDVLIAYAAAWTSGKAAWVSELYDPAAVREDPILGLVPTGADALSDAAGAFFADHPGATWELLLPFGSGTTHGGVFAITDASGCRVRAAIVAHIDGDKIVREEVYYEGASLLACDWLA